VSGRLHHVDSNFLTGDVFPLLFWNIFSMTGVSPLTEFFGTSMADDFWSPGTLMRLSGLALYASRTTSFLFFYLVARPWQFGGVMRAGGQGCFFFQATGTCRDRPPLLSPWIASSCFRREIFLVRSPIELFCGPFLSFVLLPPDLLSLTSWPGSLQDLADFFFPGGPSAVFSPPPRLTTPRMTLAAQHPFFCPKKGATFHPF